MQEFELTFLAKSLPKNLKEYPSKEIIDLYIPKSKEHPTIRLRKNGNRFELTKKEPIHGSDSSHQLEQTISLNESEYKVFSQIKGKRASKVRYEFPYEGRIAEIDVFQANLAGLVVVDFEFKNKKEMSNFKMPDSCLVDVTQEKFIAGGMLCGKSYKDIKSDLDKFDYKKIEL